MSRWLLVGGIALGVVALVAVVLYFSLSSTLTIKSSPSDIRVTINGQVYTVHDKLDVSLRPGSYQLTAQKTGYDNQAKTVKLGWRQHQTVGFSLNVSSNPQFYGGVQTPANLPPLQGGVDYKILNPHYFYNNQWAVAEFVYTNESANGGYMVFKLAGGRWVEVTSGTSFGDETRAIVPSDVFNYLQSVTE